MNTASPNNIAQRRSRRLHTTLPDITFEDFDWLLANGFRTQSQIISKAVARLRSHVEKRRAK